MITNFTVLGGDERLLYMSRELEQQGFSVELFGFEKLEEANEAEKSEKLREALKKTQALILPIPASRDGRSLNAPFAEDEILLQDVIDNTETNCTVFCGMAGKLSDAFFKKGIRVYDYAVREEFAVRNAVPTAEGVVGILIRELPTTVRNSRIFVTGFGRTAKACAKLLSSMGARVSIGARRCSSLAAAENEGYEALYIRELHRHVGKADAIINTVPSQILDEKILKEVRADCLLVEIASFPYGIDFAVAQDMGLRVINAPSLPGKTSPKTAGTIIGDTVLNIIREGYE